MTLVSDIIKSAFRESNLIPLAASPSSNQETEALNRLNALILSTLGNEVGSEVIDLRIGGDYDQSSSCEEFIPDDVRLVLNLSAATELSLDPAPYEGQRLSIVDAGANLATYNLTLDGNGRNIEGSSSLVLSTNGAVRQLMYRADTANWVRIESLTTSDEMPFPEEFDDYFITCLALRLNPRYGIAMPIEVERALMRSRSQIRARYRKRMPQDAFFSVGTVHPRYPANWWGDDYFSSGDLSPWP